MELLFDTQLLLGEVGGHLLRLRRGVLRGEGHAGEAAGKLLSVLPRGSRRPLLFSDLDCHLMQ